MKELLHKFKLGNEAELLLEKRGGGYEKVATVPIGSQALGVTQSAQGVVKYVLRVTQAEYDALVSGSSIDLETAYVVTEGALYVGLTLISNVGGGGGGATRYDSALPALSNYFTGAAGNATMTGSNNTGGGKDALKTVTTGAYLTAFGYRAGYLIATGQYLSAFGTQSFQSATGDANSGSGCWSGYSTTTGHHNTMGGFRAGYSGTDASYNTANGGDALYSNISGYYNTAMGYQCLYNNKATGNTGYGEGAGFGVTTATNLTVIGRRTAFSKTTGVDCTYLGHQAGYSGFAGEVNTGDGVTAVGAYSFGHSTSGSYNTGCGRASGWYVTTGSNNTNLGYRSGYGNTIGNDNISVGFNAGHNTSTGQKNSYIGTLADYYVPDTTSMTGAAVAGGALPAGAYSFRITFVLDGVETALSEPPVNVTTAGGNLQAQLSSIPTYAGPKVCSARKIYRSKIGGEHLLYLAATIADNSTTTITDGTLDASLGAQPVHSSGSVMLGYKARGYKSGQFVVGSSAAPISEVYVGGDIDDPSPAAVTHCSSNGSGTNVAGGDHRIAGGRGTGSAKGGRVILSASPAGSAGTGANALTDWVALDGAGFLAIKESSSAAVPTAAAGSINLFVEGGALKFRDSSGTVKTVTAA